MRAVPKVYIFKESTGGGGGGGGGFRMDVNKELNFL